MKLKEAKEITGGLSNPSKMPGYSYNLPAAECKTGSILRKVEGTVCSDCYACKGRYLFDNVKRAMYKRLDAINDMRWVNAMTVLIKHYCKEVPYFRFHDSGDLQSITHLDKIVKLVKGIPEVKFWLPTLESKMIRDYFYGDYKQEIPANLNIRISSAALDRSPAKQAIEELDDVTFSSVRTDVTNYPKIFLCHATTGDHECGDCRKCWDKNFEHVIYVKH